MEVLDIPRPHIGTVVLDGGDSRKLVRPFVQVFLVCVSFVFESVVTPVEALGVPVVQAAMASLLIAKRYPTDIKPSVSYSFSIGLTESVFDDADRGSLEFFEDGGGGGKEIEIRVEVGK